FYAYSPPPYLPSFPPRRSSDLVVCSARALQAAAIVHSRAFPRISVHRLSPRRTCFHPRIAGRSDSGAHTTRPTYPRLCARACSRSEEHTSELQSLRHLVCRLLL